MYNGGACFPKDTEAFASFARNMNVNPDLPTAISINKQMENLNSATLIVKEQLEKDHNIKEPGI
jgi:UDP-glucose 6-dehydrogenase